MKPEDGGEDAPQGETHILPEGLPDTEIGKTIAQKAIAKGVTQVAFDRNGYRYHGRVKALAEAIPRPRVRIRMPCEVASSAAAIRRR